MRTPVLSTVAFSHWVLWGQLLLEPRAGGKVSHTFPLADLDGSSGPQPCCLLVPLLNLGKHLLSNWRTCKK